MRIYKLYSARRALEALDRKRLKVSTLADINDPFEFGAISAHNKSEREGLEIARQNLMKNKGIISFSRSWTSPLIWSHYGENHKGIALGFDVPDSLLTKVKYEAKRPKIADYKMKSGGLRPELGELAVAIKAEGWRYEEEVRLFTKLETPDRVSGLYFSDFSADLVLKEVVLGARYESRNDLTWTKELMQGGVEFTTARMAFHSFAIVQQKNSRKWKSL